MVEPCTRSNLAATQSVNANGGPNFGSMPFCTTYLSLVSVNIDQSNALIGAHPHPHPHKFHEASKSIIRTWRQGTWARLNLRTLLVLQYSQQHHDNVDLHYTKE